MLIDRGISKCAQTTQFGDPSCTHQCLNIGRQSIAKSMDRIASIMLKMSTLMMEDENGTIDSNLRGDSNAINRGKEISGGCKSSKRSET